MLRIIIKRMVFTFDYTTLPHAKILLFSSLITITLPSRQFEIAILVLSCRVKRVSHDFFRYRGRFRSRFYHQLDQFRLKFSYIILLKFFAIIQRRPSISSPCKKNFSAEILTDDILIKIVYFVSKGLDQLSKKMQVNETKIKQ